MGAREGEDISKFARNPVTITFPVNYMRKYGTLGRSDADEMQEMTRAI